METELPFHLWTACEVHGHLWPRVEHGEDGPCMECGAEEATEEATEEGAG